MVFDEVGCALDACQRRDPVTRHTVAASDPELVADKPFTSNTVVGGGFRRPKMAEMVFLRKGSSGKPGTSDRESSRRFLLLV